MESKLFAFRVARPIEEAGDTPLEFTYNPRTQTAVWSGNGTAIASLYCSVAYFKSGYTSCNAYGNYCTTGGRKNTGWVKCDG